MNTRSEIEEYLKSIGVEIQTKLEDRETTEYGSDVLETERYLPITGERVVEDNVKRFQTKVLNNEAKNALLNLINQSIMNGDMETANTALEVLQEESGYYKGHRNQALSMKLPLDKRIEFEKYCESINGSKEFTGPMAAFMASAQKVAKDRRTQTVNKTTSEIKDATLEREKSEREQ